MKSKAKVLLLSIFTNIFLIIIKILGGIFGKSRTLLVDGIHSLSDFSTDLFSLMGVKMSEKPADEEHPFGHGKLENVFSLIIGIIIIIVGIVVLKDTFMTKPTTPRWYLVILCIVTIAVKFLVSSYVYRKGVLYNSPILVSNAKESRMDVVSSIFAMIVLVLSQFPSIKVFKYIDIFGGALISFFIIFVGLDIMKKEINYLIGQNEDNSDFIDMIKNKVQTNKIEIANIKAIKFGNRYVCLVEICLDSKLSFKQADKIRNSLEEKLKMDENIEYIFVKMLPK